MNGTRTCSVDDCAKHPRSLNSHLCEMHYYRVRRTGKVGPAHKVSRQPDPGQHTLWSRIEVTGFCWNWNGRINKQGYGRVSFEGVLSLAHRAVYEELVGLIPAGLVIDHLCRNTLCVNPDHLEPVTQAENQRRGLNGVLAPDPDYCRYGHKRRSKHGDIPPCLECHLIQTHARRGKNCTIEAPCHAADRTAEKEIIDMNGATK